MSEFDGRMRDPEYARLHNQRPQHPDFWPLSTVIRALDDASQHESFEELVSSVIDADVVTYMAEQRVMRALNAYKEAGVTGKVAMIGVWMDAFMAGAMWGMSKANERKGEPT